MIVSDFVLKNDEVILWTDGNEWFVLKNDDLKWFLGLMIMDYFDYKMVIWSTRFSEKGSMIKIISSLHFSSTLIIIIIQENDTRNYTKNIISISFLE